MTIGTTYHRAPTELADIFLEFKKAIGNLNERLIALEELNMDMKNQITRINLD